MLMRTNKQNNKKATQINRIFLTNRTCFKNRGSYLFICQSIQKSQAISSKEVDSLLLFIKIHVL